MNTYYNLRSLHVRPVSAVCFFVVFCSCFLPSLSIFNRFELSLLVTYFFTCSILATIPKQHLALHLIALALSLLLYGCTAVDFCEISCACLAQWPFFCAHLVQFGYSQRLPPP